MNRRYYLPIADDKKAAWNEYRDQYFEHHKAVSALAKELGGTRFCVGFGGSLVGLMFDGPVHPAFSDKPNKHGAHVLKSRGRSNAQKEAIKEVEARNAEIRKMVPNAVPIAEAHGFISNVSYKYEGVHGRGCIYYGFDPYQPTWFGGNSDVILVTGDYEAFVAEQLTYKPDSVFDPPSFSTPEGYEEISETRYKFMKAEFELKKEESRL